MSAIRLKAPSSCDGFHPTFLCRHRECPMYKAPPCFTKRLEELLSSRSCCETNYPDWKTFTRHFNINIPVGEIGVVRYWVSDHHNKDEHTIQRVMDFAEKEGHPPLLHQFQYLIEVHKQVNPGHVCTGNPADCFNFCENCESELEHRREEEKAMGENKPSGSEVYIPESHPGAPSTPPPGPLPDVLPGCDEVIHVLAPSLFEKEFPYKLFLDNYWILEPIIVLFLAYQTISSIFITLCENGGAYAVFRAGFNAAEFINRIITLLLRILVRVLAPFTFYRQICSMAEAEKALQKKIKKDDYTLPSPNPVPYHKHVNLWSIISHAIIFSLLLLYLGAFLTAEDRLKDRSISINKLFRIQVPLIGMRLFVFFDCLSCFFVLMLVGLVKDCYCIENRLSTANDKYFDIIRKRWYRIDIFCYSIPLLLIIFTVISLSYNKPITPAPMDQLREGELEIWCFWMIVLPLLQFFGSSSNSTAKLVTVIGNILILFCAFLFATILGVDKASFPPGSSVIHYYSFLSMTTLNLLYCLTKAHARHKNIKSKRFWLSLSSLVFLVISLFAIVIHEVISFAIFVSWT